MATWRSGSAKTRSSLSFRFIGTRGPSARAFATTMPTDWEAPAVRGVRVVRCGYQEGMRSSSGFPLVRARRGHSYVSRPPTLPTGRYSRRVATSRPSRNRSYWSAISESSSGRFVRSSASLPPSTIQRQIASRPQTPNIARCAAFGDTYCCDSTRSGRQYTKHINSIICEVER